MHSAACLCQDLTENSLSGGDQQCVLIQQDNFRTIDTLSIMCMAPFTPELSVEYICRYYTRLYAA